MAHSKHPSALSFMLHPDATWDVERSGGVFPAAMRVRLGVVIKRGRQSSACWASGAGASVMGKPVRIAGVMRKRTRIDWLAAPEGVCLALEYAIDASLPVFYWRVGVRNTGPSAWRLDRLVMLDLGKIGKLNLSPTQEDISIYCNGWQSWSFAGALHFVDSLPGWKLGPVNAPMHNGGGRQAGWGRGKFRSDMFTAIADSQGSAAVIGFLSQKEQFGGVLVRLDSSGPCEFTLEGGGDEVTVDPGESVFSDWASLILAAANEPALDWYLEAVARENKARVPGHAPAGWCSWYHYYENITETALRENLEHAVHDRHALPLELIQLDDGYEANVGDWLERNGKFPSMLQDIAASIRKAGFQPGIWLAPFVAKPDSRLAREHPDWLLKNEQGRRASAGFLWMRWCHALDVTKPDVMAYVGKVITTAVKEWGFSFLKLDFLYAAAVAGQGRHAKKTRAQILRIALEKVRAAAGEKTFLLGCGCPLGSGIGIFDAMRIGPDVDRRWNPHVFGCASLARRDATVPSAFNSARNILARAPMHRRWWWNDPDCLPVRDADTYLSQAERHTLATAIAITGGMLLFSDNLAALSPASRAMAQSMLPPMTNRATIHDGLNHSPPEVAVQKLTGSMGEWYLLAVFNWKEKSVHRKVALSDFDIPENCAAYSYWKQQELPLSSGCIDLDIPSHGCALVGIHAKTNGACYLGSTLHISQGSEISKWKSTDRQLKLTVQLPRLFSGKIALRLPAAPKISKWKQEEIGWIEKANYIFEFIVVGDESGELVLRW